MKLVATQWISDYLPEGATFEIPDDDLGSAHALIEGGYARKDLSADDEPAAATEPAPRRTYRRRDVTAEP